MRKEFQLLSGCDNKHHEIRRINLDNWAVGDDVQSKVN